MLLSKVLNDYYVLPLGQSEIVGFVNLMPKIIITWCDSDTGVEHDQTFDDQEIQPSPTKVPGEFYVKTTHGEEVAFIALDGVALKPERLLIDHSGGVIQAALSERTIFQVAFIDYDDDGADPDEVANIPQDDGTTEEAVACIRTTEISPAFIERAFASINC